MDQTTYPTCDDPECVIEGYQPHTTNYARCKHFSTGKAPAEPYDLEDLRTECRLAWSDGIKGDAPMLKLANGPLRGYSVPEPEGKVWQGAWFDDAGQQVLVTYEINDEGIAEYSGSKTMADIATDVANSSFDAEREHGDEPDVDIDALPAEEACEFLKLDNERRVRELFEASEGQADLSNAFDLLEVQIMLRHLIAAAGPKVKLETELDFGNEVSLKLDDIEDKYEKFREAREIAEREAMLQGGPRPVHQGRVTMPPRRIRRQGRG
jgi:hypothetical protein